MTLLPGGINLLVNCAGIVDVHCGSGAPATTAAADAAADSSKRPDLGAADFRHGRLRPLRIAPQCVLVQYQCTRTHPPHPPRWPGHSFPQRLLVVHWYNGTLVHW
jgi:hypothetical protein